MTLPALRHIITRSCEAMTTRKLRKPTHLVLDYDGTLAVKDTMAVIGTIPESPPISWDEMTDEYMKDYAEYKKQPFPWKKYDRTEYSGWLASRKWVEERSARRVQDAGFFRDVSNESVRNAVSRAFQNGNLEMRDGWEKLVELFLPESDSTHSTRSPSCLSILSVNWSGAAIRHALWQAAHDIADHPEREKLCHLVNEMAIQANEIEGLESPGGSSGRVCRESGQDIRTSDDKLRYLPPRRQAQQNSTPYVVYVGDSSTDFDCLCAADLGIWICPVPESEYKEAFADAFKPFNFVPPPLTSYKPGCDEAALFYWAPDLHSVYEALTVEMNK